MYVCKGGGGGGRGGGGGDGGVSFVNFQLEVPHTPIVSVPTPMSLITQPVELATTR